VVACMSENRKVFMPGSPLDAADILGELSPNKIIVIPHRDSFVVMFINSQGISAREMNRNQLDGFSKEVIRVHEAIRDDANIALLEREFSDRENDE